MQKDVLNNVHIQDEQVLITPQQLKDKLPVSESALSFIEQSRKTVADIIHKRDHRLLVVCGPCSIHDVEAAKDYARRLKNWLLKLTISCTLSCECTLKNRGRLSVGRA